MAFTAPFSTFRQRCPSAVEGKSSLLGVCWIAKSELIKILILMPGINEEFEYKIVIRYFNFNYVAWMD